MIKEVIIEQVAKDSLIRETLISTEKGKETGGVLAGFYQNNQLIITTASGPGPKASQSEIEFIMDKNHMDAFLDKEYSMSKGNHIYVGEWHTHPQIYPVPSDQDFKSFYERTIEWNYGEIVFLIIGFIDFHPNQFMRQVIVIQYLPATKKFYTVPVRYR